MTAFVIVGGGLAGAKAVEALRDRGFDGDLVLVGAERHLPYERPSLSKDYLAGKSSADDAVVHPEQWYADRGVQLRLGSRAIAIDRAAHTVGLADGTSVGYDKLLIATGSSPRLLPVPGGDSGLYLRDIEDAEAIKATFGDGRRLVVVGGGWIGLEVAAAARQAGTDVTVVEVAQLPLLRVLGTEIATVFADLHRANGVELRLGAQVERVSPTGVTIANGELPADAVVVGIGVTPNTALASDAGIEVDDGVLVDASLRTSDPDVFAAGDVANVLHPLLGRRVRVEHWANALNQPAVAAAAMLGEDASYDELPYFYTDQFDLGMEYIGYVEPGGYDRVVVRGDTGAREFIAFWLRDGRVLAGMNVNVWDVVEPVKALIRARTPVDPDRLADPAVPLENLT